MYTLEIDGAALVVVDASEEEAQAVLESDDFKADLRTLTRGRRPLWDGAAPMTIRRASAAEVEAFEETVSDTDGAAKQALAQEAADSGVAPIDIVFLVEVDEEVRRDRGGASLI